LSRSSCVEIRAKTTCPGQEGPWCARACGARRLDPYPRGRAAWAARGTSPARLVLGRDARLLGELDLQRRTCRLTASPALPGRVQTGQPVLLTGLPRSGPVLRIGRNFPGDRVRAGSPGRALHRRRGSGVAAAQPGMVRARSALLAGPSASLYGVGAPGCDSVKWPHGDGGKWPHLPTRRGVVTQLCSPGR